MTSPWRRSSRCEAGNCVEISHAPGNGTPIVGDIEVKHVGGNVYVRDSANPDGTVLEFTDEEWKAFKAGALAGEFHPDRP